MFNISSTAPFVTICFSFPSSTITDKRLREKSKGISSTFLYFIFNSYKWFSRPFLITASSILPLNPVWKYAFKNAYFRVLKSVSPFTSKYFSKTILSSVNVPVLSVHKIFIAPKFCIASSFFTIVFFLDILTAPFERLEDKMTGKSNGVIAIAIATANVKAVTISCFQAFRRNTNGIIANIKWISNLLMFSIPFWNAVLGLLLDIVCATFPK